MNVLDGPDVPRGEALIVNALHDLGASSVTVAAALREIRLQGPASTEDPLCCYLRRHVDPHETEIRIDGCDGSTVDFAVRNPDGETWTHAITRLPWPVLIFCVRVEQGEWPDLAPPAVPR